jgi:uncharacterized protein YjbJ (UPF0337 family)
LQEGIEGIGTPIAFIGRTERRDVPQSGAGHMADDLNRDGIENQVKGASKQVEGKVRNAVGGLTGDTSEQLKGKAKDLEGKAQRKIGEAETNLDD